MHAGRGASGCGQASSTCHHGQLHAELRAGAPQGVAVGPAAGNATTRAARRGGARPGPPRSSPSARSNMHSYWISNCSGLVTLLGLSSTFTLVTEMAVMGLPGRLAAVSRGLQAAAAVGGARRGAGQRAGPASDLNVLGWAAAGLGGRSTETVIGGQDGGKAEGAAKARLGRAASAQRGLRRQLVARRAFWPPGRLQAALPRSTTLLRRS